MARHQAQKKRRVAAAGVEPRPRPRAGRASAPSARTLSPLSLSPHDSPPTPRVGPARAQGPEGAPAPPGKGGRVRGAAAAAAGHCGSSARSGCRQGIDLGRRACARSSQRRDPAGRAGGARVCGLPRCVCVCVCEECACARVCRSHPRAKKRVRGERGRRRRIPLNRKQSGEARAPRTHTHTHARVHTHTHRRIPPKAAGPPHRPDPSLKGARVRAAGLTPVSSAKCRPRRSGPRGRPSRRRR